MVDKGVVTKLVGRAELINNKYFQMSLGVSFRGQFDKDVLFCFLQYVFWGMTKPETHHSEFVFGKVWNPKGWGRTVNVDSSR